MVWVFPRPSVDIPAETNRVVQVKYTNPSSRKVAYVLYPLRGSDRHRKRGFQDKERESMLSGSETGARVVPASLMATSDSGLSLSGSDQAREGRLVNALAARGDERRDTLR